MVYITLLSGIVPFQPLEVWRRIARIVRMLCAVCIALRKYAMDAGLMENYVVAVSSRRWRIDHGREECEEVSFNLEDFRLGKEVSCLNGVPSRPELTTHT